MPRKKKKSLFPSVLKFTIVSALALVVGLLICNQSFKVLKKSDYFEVKTIAIDPALQFINKNDLKRYVGRNIFNVDIEEVHNRLARRYPQVSDLKVIKKYPNQIRIGAKERKPFAQTKVNDRTLTVDERGIVLSTASKQNKKLPFIEGAKLESRKTTLGLPLKGRNINVALQIIKSFEKNRSLSAYRIVDMNVNDLSKIDVVLSNDLKVFLDRDQIDRKIGNLSLVLQKSELDLEEVKYLDLRFKQPVIGKR